MNVFNSNGKAVLMDNMNGINSLTNNNVPLQYSPSSTQYPNNAFPSKDFKDRNYRFNFPNPYLQNQSNVQIKNSSFLAYLHTNKSIGVGPIILNVCCSNNNVFGESYIMDFQFINEDQLNNLNTFSILKFKDIQSKFESILNYRNIIPLNKFESFEEFMKSIYENEELKFQAIPLPFEPFRDSAIISNSLRAKYPSDSRNSANEEYLEFIKQEILLLKDQNQLLKSQLDISSKTKLNTPVKEYVVRKSSFITSKSSRDLSATSTSIPIPSTGTISPEKSDIPSNTKSNTRQGSQLHEILQEYMLENEALRNQNDALNEMRARHHSELDLIFRQNQNLSKKVKELSNQISNYSVRNSENISPEPIVPQRTIKKDNQSDTQNQVYPIMYEKNLVHTDKNSYLRKYDTSKQKINMEINKRSCQVFVKPGKPLNNNQGSETVSNTFNDSLREELGRIDNTIKEHIRNSQFNDTLRNMGMKNNVLKK